MITLAEINFFMEVQDVENYIDDPSVLPVYQNSEGLIFYRKVDIMNVMEEKDYRELVSEFDSYELDCKTINLI